jgi:hypothetical protein
MVRRAAAMSWSRAWATRASARACWSSRLGSRTCSRASPAAWRAWAVCRRCCSGIARPASTATKVARARAFAAFCGQLKIGWRFCAPADPQAKGAVERLQGYAETNFEPGRRFANELDFQDQLDAWFAKANGRAHKSLKVRPIDRLADERLAPLPQPMPGTARRWTVRVPPDPYLRVDTNDYSLDPGLVGRRVEVIVDQREVTALALDTGELACRHGRVFARHRTITALEHARALRADRHARHDNEQVQIRPLDVYDALIA